MRTLIPVQTFSCPGLRQSSRSFGPVTFPLRATRAVDVVPEGSLWVEKTRWRRWMGLNPGGQTVRMSVYGLERVPMNVRSGPDPGQLRTLVEEMIPGSLRNCRRS